MSNHIASNISGVHSVPYELLFSKIMARKALNRYGQTSQGRIRDPFVFSQIREKHIGDILIHVLNPVTCPVLLKRKSISADSNTKRLVRVFGIFSEAINGFEFGCSVIFQLQISGRRSLPPSAELSRIKYVARTRCRSNPLISSPYRQVDCALVRFLVDRTK